jgi:hypothetical protein
MKMTRDQGRRTMAFDIAPSLPSIISLITF